MMQYRVIFSRRAESQLTSIFNFIASASSPSIAARFTDSIVEYCLGFSTFPHRGKARDDILAGLRTVGFRRRVTVVFRVRPKEVAILGVFYGGQDVEADLARQFPK